MKIVWCEKCNAMTLTEEEIDCLHCEGPVKEIGWEDKIVQDIINTEIVINERDIK